MLLRPVSFEHGTAVFPTKSIQENPSKELGTMEEFLNASCKMPESETPSSIKQASGMRGIACKICSKIYSERNPPLILLCGHSCCTSCLAQIIDSNKICHVCKRGLLHLDVSRYPINYTVLEVSEECSSLNNLRKRAEIIYKTHQKTLSVAESSVSNVMTNKDEVEAMKLNNPKLLQIIETDDDSINVKMADAALDDIERLMKKVADIFPSNNENVLEGKTNPVQRHLNSPGLMQMYNAISNGTLFVAHKIINKVDSFAKISIDGSSILLHAFRSSPKNGPKESFPKDGHFTSFPKEDLAKVIEFEDFQNATRWMKLRAFVDANRNRLYIDLMSQSVRSYFLLQLCTGEVGVSYLNGYFYQSCITVDEKSSWSCNNQYLQYFSEGDSYFNCDIERTYAKFALDGTINFGKGFCGNNQNICGLVVNPEALKHMHSRQVVNDCGIGHTF